MAALKRMRPRDRGTIVQVGSALAERSIPLQSAYCGAKHAIAGFTESLRSELIHDKSNVRITTVRSAGREHDAVRVDEEPHAAQAAGRPARSSSRRSPPSGIVFAADHPWRKKVMVGFPPGRRSSARSSFPARWTTTSPMRHGKARNCPSRPTRTIRTTSGNPLPGDHGSHGPFDSQAKNYSGQLWATEHRTGLLLTLAGIGLGDAVAAAGMRRNDDGARRLSAQRSQSGVAAIELRIAKIGKRFCVFCAFLRLFSMGIAVAARPVRRRRRRPAASLRSSSPRCIRALVDSHRVHLRRCRPGLFVAFYSIAEFVHHWRGGLPAGGSGRSLVRTDPHRKMVARPRQMKPRTQRLTLQQLPITWHGFSTRASWYPTMSTGTPVESTERSGLCTIPRQGRCALIIASGIPDASTAYRGHGLKTRTTQIPRFKAFLVL